MSTRAYVHGYSSREHQRLVDQASTLTELLHSDTVYPPSSEVLEAGCGVGAQTVALARNSPLARITSVDVSSESLATATDRAVRAGITNVVFQPADIFDLPFSADRFDHVFVCFVLEHLRDPAGALSRLRSVLKPGGTITVIEGDHGSTYFYPESAYARRAIQCLVDTQAIMGGDSLIGRRLYPLLDEAGFSQITVSPRMVYVDASKPHLVDGFTKNTFIAMVEGVGSQSIEKGMIDADTWGKGVRDLYRTTDNDGVFCYTFFKALATK